jgi:hypothetical protein
VHLHRPTPVHITSPPQKLQRSGKLRRRLVGLGRREPIA